MIHVDRSLCQGGNNQRSYFQRSLGACLALVIGSVGWWVRQGTTVNVLVVLICVSFLFFSFCFPILLLFAFRGRGKWIAVLGAWLPSDSHVYRMHVASCLGKERESLCQWVGRDSLLHGRQMILSRTMRYRCGGESERVLEPGHTSWEGNAS